MPFKRRDDFVEAQGLVKIGSRGLQLAA